MKAVKIIESGKIEIVEDIKPKVGVGEVLLKIKYVGFCGSDLNTYLGKNPLVSYPRIPGHEIFAVIEKTGKDVPERFIKGMNVTVIPYTNCGKCSACRKGRLNACVNNKTLGVQRDGAMCEYISIPWEKVIYSESLTAEKLVLVEPLTIGFHAVSRAKVGTKEIVMVLGCGMVGIGAIAGAVLKGAKVIAVDIDDKKLSIAKKIGASYILNSQEKDLHKEIKQITRGPGPDVVIEAVGDPKTYISAVDEVAYAGRVVCVGYAKENVSFATKLFVHKEIDIRGSRNASQSNFRSVIKYLENIDYDINELITSKIGLGEVADSIKKWSSNPANVLKIIVDLEKK